MFYVTICHYSFYCCLQRGSVVVKRMRLPTRHKELYHIKISDLQGSFGCNYLHFQRENIAAIVITK